jgi:PKD repeat protein
MPRFACNRFQVLETSSRKSLIGLAALTLGPVARPAGAQALPTGQGEFILARSTAPDEDTREFLQSDRLLIWVRAPRGKEDLAGGSIDPLSGWWRLDGGVGALSGPLQRAGGGLGAEVELNAVPRTDDLLTWTATVEWKGRVVAELIAPLRVQSLAPRADFRPEVLSGEAPLAVAFADASSGGVTTWSWDFGDGSRSSAASPTHVFRSPGSYTVTLTTTNRWGSDTRVADPIVVHEQDFAIHYGMNASENVWWQRGIAFADAMARASEFNRVVDGSINRVAVPLIPLGQDPPRLGAGWPDVTQLAPGEKAGARLFGNMAGTIPDGRAEPYVLTWEGSGSCSLFGTPVVREEHRGAQRVEVFVDPTAGSGNALLLWVLDESDPLDPVRNAHVWLPGTEAERPILWPPFVEKLAAMNGGRGPVAWRSMDWSEVNQYGRTDGAAPFTFDLAGAITPASPSQGTRRGVCVEFQVALANAVGADLHLNVPHAASNISDADYERFLRELFTRVRDGSSAVLGVNGGRPFAPLEPARRLTLEFSNEIWNSLFPVNGWLRARASANGRTLHQEAAAQIRRVFDIADEVFASWSPGRLRKFVGGFMGDARFLMEVLAALGPIQIDAVGPAFYFGPRRGDIDGWMLDATQGYCPNCPLPEEVIESARARIVELDLKLLEHQLIASAHQNPDGTTPRLELYEAGASFAAGFQPWGTAANQAQRLPGMYDAYVSDLLPALLVRGVDTVLWYSFIADGGANNAGQFGHWERMDQTLTLPVADAYHDEGVPKAAAIYRLPPRSF